MLFYVVKRLMDIVSALVLLVVLSPIMLVTAIIISLTTHGPVFVEKKNSHMLRVGKDGKIFRLYKFRSMPVNADKLITNDPRFKSLYKEYKKSSFKLHKDPRVSKFGKFIRKYSIDETPQLLNVLRGEMSLVGPRPYHLDELDEQQKAYPGTHKYVLETQTVKPGITGFWQVSGRSNINFDKRIQMDADYAKKKSLLLDIIIILRTPWAIVTSSGAV